MAVAILMGFALASCSSGSASPFFVRASGPMPAISGATLEGTSFGQADYAGKVVVVNFWNYDCPPCRQEQPVLQADWTALKSKGVSFVGVMFVGGVHLPRDLIGLVVWALLEHGLYATVRGDPALAKAAVEETLRCYSPVGTSTRQTTRETELAGVALPTGSLVAAVASSANRDPRRFTDPDRFDIHRREGANLAFATGSHFCLGAWLSRYQARTSVDVIVGRLPGLRLDAQYPIDIRGWEFRVPASLHVRWD